MKLSALTINGPRQRVIILSSHKWDLKGLLYLCFPCPLDRSRKRCCSLSVACLFSGPGGVGDLLGGAPQSLWYCEGPSSCVTAFQECREGRKVLCFVDILLKPSCQEEEEAARSRLPVVPPHLAAFLCFPTPLCLSLTSRQSYCRACSFYPISGHAAVAQESLCLAGVLYMNAVKSIVAAACVWDCAWGCLQGDLCSQHPLSWAAEL